VCGSFAQWNSRSSQIVATRPDLIVAKLLEGKGDSGAGQRALRARKRESMARRSGATGSGRAAPPAEEETEEGREKGKGMLTWGPQLSERRRRGAHVGRAGCA
jgi:hypothetical protein